MQNNENLNEITKVTCDDVPNKIINQIKYECEFDIKGEEIKNIQLLDKLEFGSQKFNI